MWLSPVTTVKLVIISHNTAPGPGGSCRPPGTPPAAAGSSPAGRSPPAECSAWLAADQGFLFLKIGVGFMGFLSRLASAHKSALSNVHAHMPKHDALRSAAS